MPLASKLRQVAVMPCQSADLAFNMPGIIQGQNYEYDTQTGPCHLGEWVSRFDIENNIYVRLGETEQNEPSKLKFNVGEIHQALSAAYLFALRNAPLAAELEQMIIQRENSYLSRHKHAQNIQDHHKEAFVDGENVIKSLEQAIDKAKKRHDKLDGAYGGGGVKKKADHKSFTQPVATRARTVKPALKDGFITSKGLDPQDNNKHVQTQETEATQSEPFSFDAQNAEWKEILSEFQNQRTEVEQLTFIHPKFDNNVAHAQLRSSLILERLKQKMASLRADKMKTIVENELKAIDQDVRRLQLNFAHTYLTPPFDGRITAIYKDVGESVAAGEPILRLENDKTVYLVGTILAKGEIQVGRPVTITSNDFLESGQPLSYDGQNPGVLGEVTAIRGHSRDNDEWEIVIEVPNRRPDTSTIFPIYYELDRSNAEFTFA